MQPNNPNNDPASSLGKNMMAIAWVIAIILLTWIFGLWEDKQYNPNSSPQSDRTNSQVEVSLERNRVGHYIVSGTVNNQQATFMLDTGATFVAVPAHLKKQLRLIPGAPYQVNTANGIATVHSTMINRLTIGDIQLENVEASLSDNMHGDEILLGMNVLKQLEFTQRGNQLTLRQYVH